MTALVNGLRSLAFHAVFHGLSVAYTLLAVIVIAAAPGRLTGLVANWSALHRRCARHILGIRVRGEGERPPGPVLYAFKHESFFEAIDLPMLLERPVVFAKEELFAIPGWGRAASAYGLVRVARSEGARALRHMVREAQAMAGSGRPLVIFPEGTRVPHGRHAGLQSGFAALYKMLGLPVVPVALDSGPLYRSFWKRPGTITIRFGAPIPPGLPRPEIEARVVAAINALNPLGEGQVG